MDRIKYAVDYIHDNGGFTIVGWYKWGIINDKSLVSQSNSGSICNNNNNNNNNNNESHEVDNGEANFHVTQIFPTNKALMDPTTLQG